MLYHSLQPASPRQDKSHGKEKARHTDPRLMAATAAAPEREDRQASIGSGIHGAHAISRTDCLRVWIDIAILVSLVVVVAILAILSRAP
jgi:hypothetical protein